MADIMFFFLRCSKQVSASKCFFWFGIDGMNPDVSLGSSSLLGYIQYTSEWQFEWKDRPNMRLWVDKPTSSFFLTPKIKMGFHRHMGIATDLALDESIWFPVKLGIGRSQRGLEDLGGYPAITSWNAVAFQVDPGQLQCNATGCEATRAVVQKLETRKSYLEPGDHVWSGFFRSYTGYTHRKQT